MPLNRWVGREPVQVTDYDLDRITSKFDLAHDETTGTTRLMYLGPSEGQAWLEITIIAELSCAAVVQDRIVWLYFKDKNGREYRKPIMSGQSGDIITATGSLYASESAEYFVAGAGSSRSFSLYTSWLPPPCKYGVRGENLNAGDTVEITMIYREVGVNV